MRKPRIAITPRLFDNNIRQGDNNEYTDAILKAGGIPYIVALNTPIEEIVNDFDGLLVTGGEDIDPALYHEKEEYPIEKSLYELDLFDLNLIKAFHQADKPILGICRGIQAINVAFGGTLYQDLALQVPSLRKQGHQQHKMEPPLQRYDVAHACTTVENTVLNAILSNHCMVNTYHHQCVKEIAKPLIASAYSEDGLIEGIENGKNIIAVQWHPERLINNPNQFNLFVWLIDHCHSF